MVLLLMMELDRETGIYKSHIEEWLKSHPGQFVLIKGDDVLGFFSSLNEAFALGTKQFGLDEFFIKQITPTDNVNVSLFGSLLQAT